MVNISNYEKRFRRKKKATFEVVGITIEYDEVKSGGWLIDDIQTKFKARWNGIIWECYYLSADVDFKDYTINKVKQNISQFFKADPAIKSYKKIIVK